MAYVLDYSAFFYSRRRHRRNAILALLGAAVLAVVLFALWWDSVTRAPTFADYVSRGVLDPVSRTRGPALQDEANRAWALQEELSSLRAEYGKFQPYLSLSWASVPVTNLLAVAAERLSGDRSLALLEPESLRIEILERPPKAVSGARALSLEVEACWRTRREYSVEEGRMTLAAVTNWLDRSDGVKPTVASLSFPNGGVAGEEIRAVLRFPGSPVLPSCPVLDETVRHLDALHKALDKASLGHEGAQELTIHYLWKDLLDARAQLALGDRQKEYDRSLSPGDWIRTELGRSFSNGNEKRGEAVFAAWEKAVAGRSPRSRRALGKILESGDFMLAENLKAFLDKMPTKGEVAVASDKLSEFVSGLTNALSAELFVPFDSSPYGRAVVHSTKNLFSLPGKLDVVPDDRALAGGDPAAESFVVSYPTVHNDEGVRLSLPGGGESSARYLFSEWSWSFSSTNAPADLAAFSRGLDGFVSRGFGYEPRKIEASLKAGRAVRIDVEGLVPVRLDTGDRRADAGKRPEDGAATER